MMYWVFITVEVFLPTILQFLLHKVSIRYVNIYICHIFLLYWPFINIKCPVFYNRLKSMSIISGISIANTAFYWLLFVWNIFFCSFIFNLSVFGDKVSLLWRACRWIMFFYSLLQIYLFWWECFIHLHLIIDKNRLTSAIVIYYKS